MMTNFENKEQKTSCALRTLTRKERYTYLHKQVSEVKHKLTTANIPCAVYDALIELTCLLDNISNESQVSEDLFNYVEDVRETLLSVNLHNATRKELDNALLFLLKRIEEIIEQEEKKENAKKLKEFLLELAEHSEEIADVIDISKIFK